MVFVLITITLIFLYKIQGNFDERLNYFVIQEVLGFLFLVFIRTILQLIVLIIKIGISPFHFWIFTVLRKVDNYLLLWFLTIQKLPFLPVLLYLFNLKFMLILLFGVILCYLQLYSMKNFKFMVTISSTESFN